jgi:hypothetical protein
VRSPALAACRPAARAGIIKNRGFIFIVDKLQFKTAHPE